MISIDFNGCELTVYYDESPPEPEVGLNRQIDIYRVEYCDCDVTDVVDACGIMYKLVELTQNKIDEIY